MSWDLIQSLRPHLVKLLGAAAVLLLGSLLGRLAASWARRAGRAALDRVGRRGRGSGAVGAARLGEPGPELVGRFVYWLVVVLAVAVAAELLGLPLVERAGERLGVLVPEALTGVAVVLVGLVVASLAGGVTAAAAASAGVRYAGAVGRGVQGLIVAAALLLGLEQVGLHGELLAVLLAAIAGVGFAGAALAFGLGARAAVANILGAYYVAQTYQVGQTIRVGGIEGRLLRATSVAVILDTKAGQVYVPASLFSEQPSTLVPEVG
jgi:hypothetical protein